MTRFAVGKSTGLTTQDIVAYQTRLKIYDDHLVKFEEFLLKQLDELEPLIN